MYDEKTEPVLIHLVYFVLLYVFIWWCPRRIYPVISAPRAPWGGMEMFIFEPSVMSHHVGSRPKVVSLTSLGRARGCCSPAIPPTPLCLSDQNSLSRLEKPRLRHNINSSSGGGRTYPCWNCHCLTRQEREIHAEEQTSRGHTHVQRSSTVWPGRRWEIHAEEQTSRGHTHMQRSSTVWPGRRWEIHAEEQTSRGHTHAEVHLLSDPQEVRDPRWRTDIEGHTQRQRSSTVWPTGGRDPRWRTDIGGSHTRPEVIYCLTHRRWWDPRWRTKTSRVRHTCRGTSYCPDPTGRVSEDPLLKTTDIEGSTHKSRRSSTCLTPDQVGRDPTAEETRQSRDHSITSRGHLLSDPTRRERSRWRTDIEGSHTQCREVTYCLDPQEGRESTLKNDNRGSQHTSRRSSTVVNPDRGEGMEIHAEDNKTSGVQHNTSRRSSTVWPRPGGRDPRW